MTAGTLIRALLLFLFLTLPAVAAGQGAAGGEARTFPLPQHGKLILAMPASWQQDVRQPRANLPPTITLTPRQGDEFKILITPIWSPQKDPTFNRPDKVKRLVENDLSGMLPGAVEQNVPLRQFTGTSGTGYYFQVTDKAPAPGDFPYAVRAGIGVGDLLLSVTVLSRQKNAKAVAATIDMLRGARQVD
jgi:hypothetical protein